MFYNLIMIQWYNKSLCNWSCSFSDMSISFLLGLLFPCNFFFLFPKKENKSYDQKPYDRQKLPGCNPVWLPIHSHNREKERQRKGIGKKKRRKKKRDTSFMFWRLVRDGNGHQFRFTIVGHREAQGIICTFCNLVSYTSRPSTLSKAHFHSCVLRVWPEPVAAHPPIADGGWPKAIWPPAPFRVNPDICWFTWGHQRDLS